MLITLFLNFFANQEESFVHMLGLMREPQTLVELGWLVTLRVVVSGLMPG